MPTAGSCYTLPDHRSHCVQQLAHILDTTYHTSEPNMLHLSHTTQLAYVFSQSVASHRISGPYTKNKLTSINIVYLSQLVDATEQGFISLLAYSWLTQDTIGSYITFSWYIILYLVHPKQLVHKSQQVYTVTWTSHLTAGSTSSMAHTSQLVLASSHHA